MTSNNITIATSRMDFTIYIIQSCMWIVFVAGTGPTYQPAVAKWPNLNP